MKKKLLFGLMAVLLAWVWFGGISMADNIVTTEDGLIEAVANTAIDEIVLGNNIALNNSLVVNRAVTIDWGEFTLSLPNTTYVSNWDNYVIKAYADNAGVTLKNIVLSDCLGAVVVGPTTTLNVDETVDVSDNVWWGIELQKWATLKWAPTMDDESFNRPVVWVDDTDKWTTTVDPSLNEVTRADKNQVFFYKNTQLVPVNFYSSENLPFPVVLSSDWKSIDRGSTKIVVNSSTLDSAYKNMILATLNNGTIIEVATIAGERVLFVWDNKWSTFRDSIVGKLWSTAFKTNWNPSTVDSKLYNLESEGVVMPSWLDGVEFTVRHTNEVKDWDKVIGYTINVEYLEWKVAWIFAPASYTVTFDVAWASSTIDPMHVDYNSTISAPTQPTKNGYNFDGWYNGETKFDFTTPITDNITLTAQWTKKSSGGGWSSSNKTPTTTWTVETWTVDTWADINTTWENTRYEEWNQQEVLKNGFTREFNNAYNFAYLNWITTMKSISKADMNWNLSRIAMAKMLSQYAINILWKTPDTTKKCEFKDVTSKMDKDYNDWVTLACQLGIMWMNMWDNFRPNDTVVRSEFGTALSRMLFQISDGTNKYYTTHLSKLKSEKIITNDDPDLQELRWYVMLMLMRSEK